MLQYKYRFHGHGSLRYLYKNGKVVRNRALSIRYVHNSKRKDSRCAIIVTRKLYKSAPKRNRIRRRVYEALRTNWQHIKSPTDIAINIFEPRFYDMPYDDLKELVVDAFVKADLWQEK
ncbi:MAG: ribonuclease P protein component [Candidatus Woesebacteria bacterium]|jgi:ribonuclease P protein component